jgi:TldD protein
MFAWQKRDHSPEFPKKKHSMPNSLTDSQNFLSDTDNSWGRNNWPPVSSLVERYGDRVDFLAIRTEESQGTEILLRGEKVETLSEELSIGGQVRVCYKGGWGFATFNQLSNLSERVEEAITAAKIVGEEFRGTRRIALAPVEPVQGKFQLPLTGTDPRNVPLAEKKALCDRYNEILRGYDERITTTSVHYSDTTQRIAIATSDGTLIEQSWVDMEARFSATACNGETVQTGRETTGSRQAYEDLTHLDEQVRSAAQRAVDALSLPPVKGDTYTVVIDPILTGLFVHEAFGHLSEADMGYENPDLLEVMSMGRRFGSKELQIFDGAAPPGHRGSYLFDDEGTPATTTQLIKDGVLVGRLHSRETAGKLGENPTGNARCLDYQYPPLVRMTNTWIERGTTPVEDLFKGIKEGVYARNWLGGMTNGEMFTFSAGEAWMIRDGKLAEPVRDVTLSGNVFKTLANIEAIGDDFYWDESGGCGKGGQGGLPVGCGGPSLRVSDVVVGGESA